MFTAIPADIVSFLLSFVHSCNLSLTCKNIYALSIKSYNELLRQNYKPLVGKCAIPTPCKIYSLINNVYHGKFDLNILKMDTLIKNVIAGNHVDLFIILRQTLPTKSVNHGSHCNYFLHCITNGYFYIASVLLEKQKHIVYNTYICVKNYYIFKNNMYADQLMNVMCHNTDFYNAIVYFSIYNNDDIYKKVLSTKDIYIHAICTAIAMCNYDALVYLLHHYKNVNFPKANTFLMLLFSCNVQKDLTVFKIIIDVYHGENLIGLFTKNPNSMGDRINNKILSFLVDRKNYNDIRYTSEEVQLMKNKPIPTNDILNYIYGL